MEKITYGEEEEINGTTIEEGEELADTATSNPLMIFVRDCCCRKWRHSFFTQKKS